jgi:hypothetical protein
MKTFFHLFPFSAAMAAAVVALSLFSANAQGAPPPNQVPRTASAAPEQDIIDIRPPIHIPAAFPWMIWSAGALAAAGLGYGAWMLRRRPRRKLPYEMALENLAKTRGLMQPENAQRFSLAVSEIVRLFIEECLPVRAAHRTTHEFLRDLVNFPNSPLAPHRETLRDFLHHCDLAKFARWSLTVPRMEAMLESANAFVIDIGKPKAASKQPVGAVPAPLSAAIAPSQMQPFL